MKHKLLTLFAAAVFVISVANLWASAKPFAQYPDNYIHFWEVMSGDEGTLWVCDSGGDEDTLTMLLNTNHIVRIYPLFTPEGREQEIRKMREEGSKVTPNIKRALHSVMVELVTGDTLWVYEDLEDFADRVRVSQAK